MICVHKVPYSTLSSPLNDCLLPNSEGGLDKGDFYFRQIFIKKLGKKFESIKI